MILHSTLAANATIQIAAIRRSGKDWRSLPKTATLAIL
jgi:hypothetical protein